MTATLRAACEHGKWDRCFEAPYGRHCPGGRVPTVEEVTQWLKERGYVPLDVQAFGDTWDRGES